MLKKKSALVTEEVAYELYNAQVRIHSPPQRPSSRHGTFMASEIADDLFGRFHLILIRNKFGFIAKKRDPAHAQIWIWTVAGFRQLYVDSLMLKKKSALVTQEVA